MGFGGSVPRLLPFRYSGVRTLVFSYFSECGMV
jgi:hypothetical protein